MIQYRPKALFQKDSKEREAYSHLAANPLLHRAIAFTQADMAAAGFGPQEMYGVNNFIVALLNLSEADEPKKPLPVKHLTSYDNPPTTPKLPDT